MVDTVRCEQFAGVGRNRSGRNYVKAGHVGLVHDYVAYFHVGACRELSEAEAGGYAEVFGKARLTDVHAHEQHALAEQGERCGKVDGYEALAVAGRCRGDEHHFFVGGGEHEQQVAAHEAEQLGCAACLG